MMNTKHTRPPIESLACVAPECDLYGQAGQNNLTIRKVYGADQIRYLRCGCCGYEFSARKGTALWNTKVREAKAVAVAEHLSEGCSQASTARLVKVDISVVQRLNRTVGQHGQRYHAEQVRAVEVQALQADERHGFSETKQAAMWEAEVMDPQSKLVLSHVQGQRDEGLIRRLYADASQRVANRHALVLFTDGEHSYASLFAAYFGVAYQPSRQGCRGRRPKTRYRIPRSLAHVQIVKQRVGRRVVEVDIRYTHGSRKCAHHALEKLGYQRPNTSAIERRNATARRMAVYQTRKSLAFARRPQVKSALGWWGVTVYNWCRPHRTLRQLLPHPTGKKSTGNAHPPWPLAWHNVFSPSGTSCSRHSIPLTPEIISHDYPTTQAIPKRNVPVRRA
jgi:transposase-like protein/IS1 family transposase